ncbi:MAG: 1-acyl-sn-glycerol-3-phosphate acyltransferase [Halobacteria archaeon]|nr:1-acyl-sn-glycerol-3-phosphate acyltransferase [Halobacteria archaeon]
MPVNNTQKPLPPNPEGTSRFVLYLRAAAFWLVFASTTLIAAILVVLMFPLSLASRQAFVKVYVRFILRWLRITCKLNHEIQGLENIPPDTCIVFSKHQSTWETFAIQIIFPAQIWVAKRELLWIPFFGWGLALMKPIALNRGSGRAAVEQLARQGTERLAEGLWVILFPEGTRVAPGRQGRYKIGGAVLAERSGYPIIPVAHNAGEYWPRRSFIKYPGTIQVRIGPPISPLGKTAQEILKESSDWIESKMAEITSAQD